MTTVFARVVDGRKVYAMYHGGGVLPRWYWARFIGTDIPIEGHHLRTRIDDQVTIYSSKEELLIDIEWKTRGNTFFPIQRTCGVFEIQQGVSGMMISSHKSFERRILNAHGRLSKEWTPPESRPMNFPTFEAAFHYLDKHHLWVKP